jgi:hypothetical protein
MEGSATAITGTRKVASGPRNGRVFVKWPSPKLTFYVVGSGGSPTLDCTLGPLGPPIQSPTRRRLSPRYCACARRLDLQVARAGPLRMARSEEAVRPVELPVLAGGDDCESSNFQSSRVCPLPPLMTVRCREAQFLSSASHRVARRQRAFVVSAVHFSLRSCLAQSALIRSVGRCEVKYLLFRGDVYV